jgi:hypothetical protein
MGLCTKIERVKGIDDRSRLSLIPTLSGTFSIFPAALFK